MVNILASPVNNSIFPQIIPGAFPTHNPTDFPTLAPSIPPSAKSKSVQNTYIVVIIFASIACVAIIAALLVFYYYQKEEATRRREHEDDSPLMLELPEDRKERFQGIGSRGDIGKAGKYSNLAAARQRPGQAIAVPLDSELKRLNI